MQKRPHDRFIIAASPAYLRAVEEDLYAAREALASPAQLTIVSSKGYLGRLDGHITLTRTAMMKALNTNMAGLNISYAAKILADERRDARAGALSEGDREFRHQEQARTLVPEASASDAGAVYRI